MPRHNSQPQSNWLIHLMATKRNNEIASRLGTHAGDLQELIGGFINAEPSKETANLSLEDLGLDSIAAVQLANELLLRLQLQIHPDELFKISLSSLTEHAQKSPPASTEPPVASLGRVDVSSASLATRPPTNNLKTIPTWIIEAISKATRIPVEQASETSTLSELGVDSFSLLEIKQQLEQTELRQFDHLDLSCTLHDLAGRLVASPQNQPRGTTDTIVTAKASTQRRVTEPPPLSRIVKPLEILALSDSVYEAAAHRSGFAGYWSSVSPLQNDLLLSYINEAFMSLGVNLSEQPHGVEIPRIPCIPKYDRLMQRLFDILESRYIVMQRGGKVLRGSDRVDVDTSSRLCEQLRTQHQAFRCEAELMDLIGPRLAECLSGKCDPLSVLFGSVASRQIMDNFYRGAPMMAAHTEQLVSFFVSLAQGMATGSQTPVRILEVGAGTGGTTAPLVAAIESAKVPLRYTFTDIGASFVNKARARWGENQWMDFSVLDIEEEMPECFRGQYDIIMGTNVVHATRDRTATCRRLREALQPGGVLVLSELTRPIDWYDICFGLLDGWWLADGGKGYAIQPATVWMEAFEKAGFKSTGHSSGNSEEANTQQVLVACNKG
ncbi:S-adenosyl-L-methionine-dependent methyltransferase [Xylariaceae sp. FL1651]|nr:S-adenosyl-L-methionine-dependent methyltransferase [Xylariaceae sp. FL1651]